MSVFAGLGLDPVVNAAGKMTYLGASVLSDDVVAACADAGRSWVDVAALAERAGAEVAAATGAEAGFVTSCSAAGLALAAAGCVTGADPGLVRTAPVLPEGAVRRIVLQKGHAIDFGAPLTSMIRMGGAEADEVGSANRCTRAELESALARPAAAVFFVVSHHVTGDELCGLGDVVAAAHARGVPVVVDAAAETDLRAHLRAGADLVVHSGHKAVGGPTSGLVSGRRDLVAACAAHNQGIGRAMKIGKEAVAGLVVALRAYAGGAEAEGARLAAVAGELAEALRDVPGLRTELVADATRPITRVRVAVRPDAGVSASELVARLAAGTPSVRVRAHHAASGWFELDPRPVRTGDAGRIGDAVRAALSPAGGGAGARG
ncbi:MAG TPA: aminotransferase class V-fold PLP-dependent enzyme [Streptosporangiaceae bacterium]